MAALNWPFSTQDVLDQFHPNEAMSHNLQNMYNDVFGTNAWGAGSELRDFDGFGRAEADTLAPEQVSCSGGNVTVRMKGDVTFIGANSMEYRFKYDTSFDFPSPSFTSWTSTSSTGTKTEDVSGFSIGDTVYVTIQYRNPFNDVAGAEDEDPNDQNVTTSKGTLSTPSIITAEYDFPDLYIEFSSDSDMGSGTGAIQTQYRWDTGGDGNYNSWQATDGAECVADLGTATAEAVINTSGGWNPGTDDVQIRVQLLSTPCDNNSQYSDPASCSSGIFSCPL